MRLLVVEDSRRLREALARGLAAEGFAVDAVDNGRDGLIHARTTEYDVIVLDLMLPEMDGMSMLHRLRELGSRTHILILSARDDVSDRVRGLEAGADDYLVKPFAFEELLARIRSLARREFQHKSPVIEIADVKLNLDSRRVSVGATVLDLARREYAILEFLMLNAGRTISRAELEEHVYDEHQQVWSNSIDSGISSIRRQLRAAGVDHFIMTRRGVGYVIEQTVRPNGGEG